MQQSPLSRFIDASRSTNLPYLSIIPFPHFPNICIESERTVRFQAFLESLQAGGTRHESAQRPSQQQRARSSVYTNEKNVKNAFRRMAQNRYSPRLCRLNAELTPTKINAPPTLRHGKRVSNPALCCFTKLFDKIETNFRIIRAHTDASPPAPTFKRIQRRTMVERNDGGLIACMKLWKLVLGVLMPRQWNW